MDRYCQRFTGSGVFHDEAGQTSTVRSHAAMDKVILIELAIPAAFPLGLSAPPLIVIRYRSRDVETGSQNTARKSP